MESKKIKIQIKNRFLGSVIFEYETEGNTLKRTVAEAIKAHVALRDADLCGANLCGANLCDANLRGADLCGANLRGADLCGANFTGAVLDYNDEYSGYGSTGELIQKIKSKSLLRPTEVYENHDAFASRWGLFWRNLIIIRKWEVAEKEEQKVNLADEQKAIVKAFATMHGVDKLEYREHGDEEYGSFAINNELKDDKILDFPTKVEGLTAETEYTLAELGIE